MTSLIAPSGRREPTSGRPDWHAAKRALLVAVAAVCALVAVYAVFVLSGIGQQVDQVGLNHLADGLASRQAVAGWLRGVTVGGVALVLLACVVVAIARRRITLGLIGVGLVVGANVTTEALKHIVLDRPHLGHGWTNSLPSGHTTVVTSLALASLLVAPRRWRAPVSLCASVAVAVAGVGTIVANWHRPSDVIAAYAVCLAWGAMSLAVVSLRTEFAAATGTVARAHPLALLTGLALAAAAFLEVGVRPNGTTPDLMIHVVVMCGIAVSGAIVVGVFTRMANARTT
jgi:membrane-associated phospholipid phosphatase